MQNSTPRLDVTD